jgi:uncharacterized phage protein gp47/JayE
MPRIRYDIEQARDNALLKIAESTGLNNFSNSSKIRVLADTTSDNINFFIDVISDIRDNLYPETANGRYLDAKATDYNVFRNSITSLSLKDTDLIVKIEPRNTDSEFSDVLTQARTIYAGEAVEGSSSFRIIFSEDITLNPGDTDLYASIRLESTLLDSGFVINQNDVFKLPSNLLELGSIGADIQLRFMKDVSLRAKDELDSDFRERVLLAKYSPSIAAVEAIQVVIASMPEVSGYAIYNNERGSSTFDVLIVTEDMQSKGEDPNASSIVDAISLRLRSTASAGISYTVNLPIKLNLNIQYSYTSDTEISENAIQDAIFASFNNLYVYTEDNQIDADNIENEVLALIPSLNTFTVDSMSLLDTVLEEYILTSTARAYGPKGTFITLAKEDIPELIPMSIWWRLQILFIQVAQIQ